MVPMKPFSRKNSFGWFVFASAVPLLLQLCPDPNPNLNASCWLNFGQGALTINFTCSHMGNAKKNTPKYAAALQSEFAVWIFSFSAVKTFWANTLQYTQKKYRFICDLSALCKSNVPSCKRTRNSSSCFRETKSYSGLLTPSSGKELH